LADKEPLDELISILAGVGRVKVGAPVNDLGVKGNEHGIKNGWFCWPFNFDPVWLEACNGFTAQKEKEA
jgi:hypothetical protein